MIDFIKPPSGVKKYVGNGNEIKIKYRNAKPFLIYGFDNDGNYFIWNGTNNKTYYYTTSWWSSTLYKYDIDNGVSLNESTKEIIIGNNQYVNESGKTFIIVILREDLE
jgi:hypothetical protein